MKKYIKPTVFFDNIEIEDLMNFSQVHINGGGDNGGTGNANTTGLTSSETELTPTEGEFFTDAKSNRFVIDDSDWL